MPSFNTTVSTYLQSEAYTPAHTSLKFRGHVIAQAFVRVSRETHTVVVTYIVWRRRFSTNASTFAVQDATPLPPLSDCVNQHVQNIRKMLNDLPAANKFLKDEQFSDSAIAFFLEQTLADFNMMPPIRTQYTLCNFPYPLILYYGAIAHLLRAATFTDARNAFPVMTGSVQFNPDRTAIYNQLAQQMEAQYQQMAARLKQQINISSGWGGDWWA